MELYYEESLDDAISTRGMTNSNPNLPEFQLETTTVWSFPDRGKWATHKGDYRGNFAPQIPRNIILRYSKKGETIIDPMVGSGTTLIEAKLLGRNGIGVDINIAPLTIAKERISSIKNNDYKTYQLLYHGDARNLDRIQDSTIDLICTHPPYLNIIKYSENNEDDISQISSIKQYIAEIKKIADECYRILKPGRYLAILIGDTRKYKHYVPLSVFVLKAFLDIGFLLKEDIIKVQWNCSSTPKWRKLSMRYNFHMIMHEHLYVFRKPNKDETLSRYKYSSSKNEVI